MNLDPKDIRAAAYQRCKEAETATAREVQVQDASQASTTPHDMTLTEARCGRRRPVMYLRFGGKE
jgi:hypothetical protein